MTSLVAAMLVEEGRIGWGSTVAELFPDLAEHMVAELRGVTLEQLLSHTSGIPSDNQAFITLLGQSLAQEDLNLDELRRWLVREWSAQPLQSAPGTPSAGAYALGWGIATLPYSAEPFLTHTGSNTMNLAAIIIQPSRDYGAVLATNVGGAKADQAIQALAEQLYKQYGFGCD